MHYKRPFTVQRTAALGGQAARGLRCIAAVLILMACGDGTDDSTKRQTPIESGLVEGLEILPLEASSGGDAVRFTTLPAEETGIAHRNELKDVNNVPFLNTGAGVAVGDIDGDGLPDLYLTSIDGPNHLYRQTAPWQFEDVTESAGGLDGGAVWSRGAAFADIDNDGDLDLFVCNTAAPNLLYRNRGDGTFEEAGEALGLAHVGASIMGYFADYDRDGDLDLYLVTYRALKHNLTAGQVADIEIPSGTARSRDELTVPTPAHRPGESGQVDPENWIDLGYGDWELAGQSDRLLRNRGDGTFEDVTEAAGLIDYGLGLSALWLDVDADGWLDLYVANDLTTRDRLYRNLRDGTFAEGLADLLPLTTWYSMGSDTADIDQDGHFDFLVADMAGSTHYRAKVGMGDMVPWRDFMQRERPRQMMRNVLFLGTGAGPFQEAAYLAGVDATDWTWAVLFDDLDNDGRVDLFFSNGAPRDDMNLDRMEIGLEAMLAAEGRQAALDYLKTIPPAPTPNLAFRNLGNLRFEAKGGTWGLDHEGVSFGAATADLDRDGDLDLVVNHLGEPAGLLRNDGQGGHRLLVSLHGRESNRFGLGAEVRLRTADGTQVRRLLPARGFMSAGEPLLHFGLGGSERITELTVHWPSGHRQTFSDLPADHHLRITEPPGAPPPPPPVAASEPLFEEVSGRALLRFRHRERPFDDYAEQPLLPGKLSQLGPGLAFADADGDGDDDLFVGGAAGQSGQLYWGGGGSFSRHLGGPWQADKGSEDMGILWLDADSDGDLDLFVASGGVEHPAGHPALTDRLYWNDGERRFRLAGPDTLPAAAESSGPAAAADFDGDGDLDLFIGGRAVPGRYPSVPRSRLLANQGGKFREVTTSLAPGLERLGLVTGALWSDDDDDGRVDLLVTTEWGPLHLFRNTGDGLTEVTQEMGLAQRRGWWSGLTGGDFNADGRIDYAVANLGLNSKYHASAEHPTVLYYGDMDADGRPEIIEAKSGDGGLLPVRGRSCSSGAMPFLAESFPTYHDFASAALEEIYPREVMQEAMTLRADTLESGLLLAGDGAFDWQPWPRRAQLAPAFGMAVADFDGDGASDLFAAQNFLTREPETGPLNGGLSVLLHGDASSEPRLRPNRDSGLVVTGDAMGVAAGSLDGDAWPDLIVARNDDTLLAFRHRGMAGRRPLALRLQGPAGNPTAVGARVLLEDRQGGRRAAEVYAGSGYLSQSAPTLYFGATADAPPESIEVRWPDGQRTRHRIPENAESLLLSPSETP